MTVLALVLWLFKNLAGCVSKLFIAQAVTKSVVWMCVRIVNKLPLSIPVLTWTEEKLVHILS